ncbi:NAD(P)-dependent dehydrogenase (short-subunit alcohol dehydrogenase family) [Lachnospiraceae bacterium PF1-21]|uniref:Glucose 1-dehydrogenase n=1 Tax=Ohessyouella blattaphilus TaxID=2949333 RepID=A0ABT1EFU5_9FIRM|nr:glucose 1-dehydrogenase [Ohessyouella blattaphilus]MCP1109568.1 glucose 1-dehydrogenase [Ohessyouella blattaphilus]MCR8562962.1 glucose 1-dehydrogenase [Ohessyouella blattaphilus]MDL2250573.1 glucose 1-dehydrogenase [Lachnospiraceae bacterium OttesenSCG-928-J05]
MNGRLNGKVAIVTGATSGIGRATAVLFANEGAKVVVAARREERGQEVVSEIEKNGGTAFFVRTDITQNEDIKNLVAATAEKYGKIDILVNNAGTLTTFNFLEMNEEIDFDRTFQTNVKSYFMLCKEVIPYMLKNGKGSIVNLASVAAQLGVPMHTAYSASKGAVKQFTKSLAGEFARSGIRVNAILPGLTNSEMVPVGSDFEKAQIDSVPMGRAGKPEEIAQGILFFASDDSSFCTGATLLIDGGHTAI